MAEVEVGTVRSAVCGRWRDTLSEVNGVRLFAFDCHRFAENGISALMKELSVLLLQKKMVNSPPEK